MTTVCNIWIISLELNLFVYDPSWILHLSEYVWTLRSSVWVVFNNFLLIDTTDRSKISSNQKRFFNELSLYPLSFFANTPFKEISLFYEKNLLNCTWLCLSLFLLRIPKNCPNPKNVMGVVLQMFFGFIWDL